MKKHPLDQVSLAFGLIFVAAVGWWAIGVTSAAVAPGWLAVAVLLALGVFGLISAVGRRKPGHPPVESSAGARTPTGAGTDGTSSTGGAGTASTTTDSTTTGVGSTDQRSAEAAAEPGGPSWPWGHKEASDPR